MKKFFKNVCIILILVFVFSFVFSCTSKDLDIESFISDTIFGSESVESESNSSITIPDVDSNPFSNLTMAFIGDSITDGAKGIDSYTLAVKDNLGLKKIYNHGVDWSTVAYKENCHCHVNQNFNHDPFVFRYNEVENADIICVFGGINDYGCLVELGTIDDNVPTTFYGALNILVSGLIENNPDSYIFFMTGFHYHEKTNSDGINWREYNEAIIDICDKYDIDCLDLYNDLPFDRDVYTVDGIHPTEDFIINIFSPMISDFIRENYKK